MKKLTALLLALILTLAFASCTSEQSAAPTQAELAESYLAELRAIFDAAGIEEITNIPEHAPFLPGETRAVFTYLDTDPATLEEVQLIYKEVNHITALELPEAVYSAAVAIYGEPNDSGIYTIQELLDLNAVPDESRGWASDWVLGDRRLMLSVYFSIGTLPAAYAVELSLRPYTYSEPITAASYSPE